MADENDGTPKFDPKKYLIQIKRKNKETGVVKVMPFLPSKARVLWLRSEHKEWGIQTEQVMLDEEAGRVIFKATITNDEGRIIAQASKEEHYSNTEDFYERAETGAIGRALALCGYGTEFVVDPKSAVFDEDVDGDDDDQRAGSRSNGNRNGNSPPGQSRKPAAAATPSADEPTRCADCPTVVTKGQEALSVRNFGVPLCPTHQKERRSVEVDAHMAKAA